MQKSFNQRKLQIAKSLIASKFPSLSISAAQKCKLLTVKDILLDGMEIECVNSEKIEDFVLCTSQFTTKILLLDNKPMDDVLRLLHWYKQRCLVYNHTSYYLLTRSIEDLRNLVN